MSSYTFRRARVLALALSALLTGAAAEAQSTGGVRGKVVDAKGAPVEDAKVVVSALEGGTRKFELKTNKKGEFIQIGLYPGPYSVTAEKDKLAGKEEIRVSLGDPTEVTVQVQPAGGGTAEQQAKAAELQKLFGEGVTASRAGQHDEAIAKFNEAAALVPNCFDCYYNIGYAQMQKKDYAAAEAALKKAVELKPDYAEAYSALANVYNAQGRLDDALAASAKAGELAGGSAAGGGGSAPALYNQGVILWNQNKFAEAAEKWEAAAKADPNYADAHYRLGMAYVNLGKLDQAVSGFEAYMKAAPSGERAEEVKNYLSALKKK